VLTNHEHIRSVVVDDIDGLAAQLDANVAKSVGLDCV
jgi:hypothetical protein